MGDRRAKLKGCEAYQVVSDCAHSPAEGRRMLSKTIEGSD